MPKPRKRPMLQIDDTTAQVRFKKNHPHIATGFLNDLQQPSVAKELTRGLTEKARRSVLGFQHA